MRKERRCKLNPKNFPKEVLANQLSTKNEKTKLRASKEKTIKKSTTDIIKLAIMYNFTPDLMKTWKKNQ